MLSDGRIATEDGRQVGTQLFHCRQLRRIYPNALHLGMRGSLFSKNRQNEGKPFIVSRISLRAGDTLQERLNASCNLKAQ